MFEQQNKREFYLELGVLTSKVHVAERKILQVRYLVLTYGWLFYKVHLIPPEKWQLNRTKIQNFMTSKALGVSYTSVHRIMNDKRPCMSNRPKERVNILDDFDHCVIKRTIHGLYSRFFNKYIQDQWELE
jgi:hypothetical protein